jgi:hypothetical protein
MEFKIKDINKLAEERFGSDPFRTANQTASQREGFVEGFKSAMEILNQKNEVENLNKLGERREHMFNSYKMGFNAAFESLKAANDHIQKKTINNEF